jgi:hypothetical protein
MNKIEAQLTAAGWVFIEQVTYTQTVARFMRIWQCPAALNAAGVDFYIGMSRNTASGQGYFSIRLFEGWNATAKLIQRPAIGGSGGGASAYFGQIQYGGGTFIQTVAAMTAANYFSNIVLTSPDGLNWTARRTSGTNPWSIAAYGNGTWVMLGGLVSYTNSPTYNASTLAATSTDNGVTWTPRTVANLQWTDCVYGSGPGLFVATAPGSAWASSPDGITWTPRTPSASGTWAAIAYGNGTYVAVNASSTTSCQQSTNGTTFTSRAISTTAYPFIDVAYGAGLFVALNASGHISYSPDGITWTLKTNAITGGGNWSSITYGDSGFVAVNNGTNASTRGWAYSVDGINWASGNSNFDTGNTYMHGVTFGAGQYIAVGSGNNASSHVTLTDLALGKPLPYGIPLLGPFAPGDHSLVNIGPTTAIGSQQTNYQQNEVANTFSLSASFDIGILASKSYLAVAVNTNGTGSTLMQFTAGAFAPTYTDNPVTNPPVYLLGYSGGQYATTRNMRTLPDTGNNYTFGGYLNPDGILAGLHTGAAKDPVMQGIRATRIALTGLDQLLAYTNYGGLRGYMYDCIAVAISSQTALKVGDTVTLGGITYTALGYARNTASNAFFGLFFNTTAGN